MTPQGTLGTRRVPIFARLPPTGGQMAAVALVVAVVLTGCGSLSAAVTPTAATPTVTAASLPQVRVQATDYHYDMPATVPAGLVAITQTNSGAQPHQVIISRLKAGVSDQQMVGAFPGEEAKIDTLSTFAGGPGIVAPGGAQAVVVSLQPGRYVAYCLRHGALRKGHVPLLHRRQDERLGDARATGRAGHPQPARLRLRHADQRRGRGPDHAQGCQPGQRAPRASHRQGCHRQDRAGRDRLGAHDTTGRAAVPSARPTHPPAGWSLSRRGRQAGCCWTCGKANTSPSATCGTPPPASRTSTSA